MIVLVTLLSRHFQNQFRKQIYKIWSLPDTWENVWFGKKEKRQKKTV